MAAHAVVLDSSLPGLRRPAPVRGQLDCGYRGRHAGRVAARNADPIRSARLLRRPETEGPPKTMQQTAAEFWLAGLPVEIV